MIIPERLFALPHQLFETPLGRFCGLLLKADFQTLVHDVAGNLNTLWWIMLLCCLVGEMITHLKKVASLRKCIQPRLIFFIFENKEH